MTEPTIEEVIAEMARSSYGELPKWTNQLRAIAAKHKEEIEGYAVREDMIVTAGNAVHDDNKELRQVLEELCPHIDHIEWLLNDTHWLSEPMKKANREAVAALDKARALGIGGNEGVKS